MTLASVARVDASFTSGHWIKPPFRPLLAAPTLVRRAAGADDAGPLFLAPDNARPATSRHVHNWLARIGREARLRFDATSGWNRYATSPWATFHELAAAALIAPAGEPTARSGRAPSHERVNRAFGGQYSDRPGYPGRGVYDLDGHRTADDRAIEALLTSVREPCTAQQLASGLGWTLTRTIDALQHLEASLANTGQSLTRLGHHIYALGPDQGSSTTARSPAACATTASRSTSPRPRSAKLSAASRSTRPLTG